MPAESFYKRTQFLTRDIDGITAPFAGEDIDIYIDEDNTFIDTVTTDSDGFIDDGTVPSYLEGTLLRFQSGALTNYYYQVTGLDLQAAYDENITASFIIDDDYTDTIEPEMVDIYLEDLDEPDVPVRKLGSVAVGGTLKVPYESAYEKSLKIYSVPSGESISGGVTNLANASSDELAFTPDVSVITTIGEGLDLTGGILSARRKTLKDFYTDAIATDTEGDLYTYILASNQLANDGDKLNILFVATFAVSIGEKHLFVQFDNVEIAAFENLTESGTAAWIRLEIVRASSSAARCTITHSFSAAATFLELTGKDFTAPIDIALRGFSDTTDEVTAQQGYIEFIPAAVVIAETDYLTFGGDRLVFGGDPLIFTP